MPETPAADEGPVSGPAAAGVPVTESLQSNAWEKDHAAARRLRRKARRQRKKERRLARTHAG